jgi:hypothetical protein
MRRVLVVGCVLVLLVLSTAPGDARAGGVPLRGQQITSSIWHLGTTGECLCDIQWYTVRLQPGVTTVNARLLRISEAMGATYSLLVWMYLGDTLVGFGKNSCPKTKVVCNKGLGFKVKVPRAGVYYLKVKGLGGEGILYGVQTQGKLSTRACAHTC